MTSIYTPDTDTEISSIGKEVSSSTDELSELKDQYYEFLTESTTPEVKTAIDEMMNFISGEKTFLPVLAEKIAKIIKLKFPDMKGGVRRHMTMEEAASVREGFGTLLMILILFAVILLLIVLFHELSRAFGRGFSWVGNIIASFFPRPPPDSGSGSGGPRRRGLPTRTDGRTSNSLTYGGPGDHPYGGKRKSKQNKKRRTVKRR